MCHLVICDWFSRQVFIYSGNDPLGLFYSSDERVDVSPRYLSAVELFYFSLTRSRYPSSSLVNYHVVKIFYFAVILNTFRVKNEISYIVVTDVGIVA